MKAQTPQVDCSGPTYAPNSTYHSNLNRLLSNLSSNASRSDGFYNTTVGQNGDAVYGLYLCRGDTAVSACQACVSQATKDIRQCLNYTRAVGWYEKCTLRYSDADFFSIEQDDPTRVLYNNGNAADPKSFMQLVIDTMNVVAKEAAYGGSGSKKYATREQNYSSFQTLYTMAQCTPDISRDDCYNCLRRTIGEYPNCCFGRLGAIARAYSCNVRYELYPFYGVISSLPSPRVPESAFASNDKSKISAVAMIAIVVQSAIFILQVSLCFLCLRWWRARKNASLPKTAEISESLHFDLDSIKTATNDFCPDNKLGQGGYGEVYKGILPGGQELAVKRLSNSSKQGVLEFKNEVVTMAKLQHRNLVRFLGFCLEEEEKILVYEYLSNKSLDNFLFEAENKGKLNWSNRYNIIEGIARGISYLHEDSQLKIIHRDLKSSNVLLDEDLNPKISDFGMARIFQADQTHADTSKVVGTFGYIAPEYAMHGHISVKSDIYSFGILILEIISGKKNTSFYASNYAENLATYAWKLWREGTPLELLDPSLRNSCPGNEVIKCIHISLLCIQESPALRPTIQFIMVMLGSHSVTLPDPQQPAFLFNCHRTDSNNQASFENSSDQSTGRSMQRSVDEDPISDMYPR
ncbi:cysteine-rich receptor-like protein kinase 10 isoform X1 [Neltuma alba]|uniref:cysteine-rich receptor-like protein kinase 10 isoform X1 n=1 Tax=Neltuma alba TaxID=207710 RepID=UPI0010A398CC|nr:cysteine-rich receptor-like protein kinase 10 isoform X1 [Prosopis alba]